MSTEEESITETYKKLSDLTEQLTSLTTMSKVVANTALLHDIHNQLAALNHLSEKYKGLLSKGVSSSDVVPPSLNNNASTARKQAENTLSDVNKSVGLNKMARFLLFIFMFFFIFKIIDHILDFFDVNKDLGYIYFVWFTIMFFLFVILPLQKSRLTATPKLEE
jgi:hypothetical protein